MTSNRPPIRKDLTQAMVTALLSYHAGKPWAHLSGRSMHGGAGQTYRALVQRGLLDSKTDTLTDDGQIEARALAARRHWLG